jgi:hypothetical protein
LGTAQRAVMQIERAPLYQSYRRQRAQSRISDGDVCDILAVTLESQPETVRKHLESMIRLAEQAERLDLVEFLKWLGEWCKQRGFDLAKE